MFSQLLKYFDPNHNYFSRFVLLTLLGGVAGMIFAAIYIMAFKFRFDGAGFWGGVLGGAVSLALYCTLVGFAQKNGPQFPLSTIIGFIFGGIIGPILGIALQFGATLTDQALIQLSFNDMLTLIMMTGLLGLGGGIAVSLSISLTITPPYTNFSDNN
jgi:hypothetical protein